MILSQVAAATLTAAAFISLSQHTHNENDDDDDDGNKKLSKVLCELAIDFTWLQLNDK